MFICPREVIFGVSENTTIRPELRVCRGGLMKMLNPYIVIPQFQVIDKITRVAKEISKSTLFYVAAS